MAVPSLELAGRLRAADSPDLAPAAVHNPRVHQHRSSSARSADWVVHGMQLAQWAEHGLERLDRVGLQGYKELTPYLPI